MAHPLLYGDDHRPPTLTTEMTLSLAAILRGNVMRTAEQCIFEAAEMDHAADVCSDPVMTSTYGKAAVMWREVAVEVASQDEERITRPVQPHTLRTQSPT